jgi:hypothetical protein
LRAGNPGAERVDKSTQTARHVNDCGIKKRSAVFDRYSAATASAAIATTATATSSATDSLDKTIQDDIESVNENATAAAAAGTAEVAANTVSTASRNERADRHYEIVSSTKLDRSAPAPSTGTWRAGSAAAAAASYEGGKEVAIGTATHTTNTTGPPWTPCSTNAAKAASSATSRCGTTASAT